jgi:hypothetical protein
VFFVIQLATHIAVVNEVFGAVYEGIVAARHVSVACIRVNVIAIRCRVLSDENLLGGIVRVDSELRARTKVDLRVPLDKQHP